MRTRPAGVSRSLTRPAALPGTAGSRRSAIAALTVALTLALPGIALAAPMPTQVDPDAFPPPPGAVAERTSAQMPAPALSPRAGSDVSSGGALDALAIVLVSVGGAAALVAVGYAATRFVHHAPRPVG